MKPKEFIYVKVRLKDELHERLKAKAQQEERSMNYLINKAVELLVNQNKEVKA
ncbi:MULTISPECIES: toxin-antitoxin system HicB family antitoxin [unclassified Acinetobacter]|uniref:toxin-antitoxin system HicB family antitoxin n=1 Tax=unclassified Acinetobacter TaxID=196816 RepID=UPI00244B5977|nr:MULTISPECIES: toxin-antitoxin system HicB family antitoxin [unclassified Acinetobacter]MDH0031332.1 toxin-antitoxin system HicB family antitoxin [Acinetobacter sp. GD04021]MDH0887183.1 toxin-antitoxin system HicB family antitoxin [Acinetobacter sp. GD03873]MDH1083528.1 toxin-antitoxin system HicB family antitoxin [Acinetobacter sp. GD03983]MDH2190499.1 toxin-antitoxin system HicB family antitoxin [Acinetobacter sp. GD03645]MDH2204055.1 toxin-antitoxin system HicB family antitoxin [Acinetoba